MITIKKIQKISTQDGHIVPIYRDWDFDVNSGYTPRMVYMTSLNPGVVKDIILHQKRSGYMTCIAGSISIEAMIDDKFQEFILDYDGSIDQIDLLMMEPDVPIKIRNLSSQTSIVLNCPDPSWHPDDQDTLKFKSWSDFTKWKQRD